MLENIMKTKRNIYRISTLWLLLLLMCGLLSWSAIKSTRVVRLDAIMRVTDQTLSPENRDSMTFAVVSDPHAGDSYQDYEKLIGIVHEVSASGADYVLLLGDYTATPASIDNIAQHRARVAKILGGFGGIPTIAVLGNYESWSDPNKWVSELQASGLTVLQNKVSPVLSKNGTVCFRGLGDAFTDKLRFTSFPDSCDGLLRITLTHDPAGAFSSGIQGIIFAGHTHCGQIKLPLIGSLWIPSEAPIKATCGLYEDTIRTLWVSSGVGTSILPVRFGAQANWDFVTIQPEETVYKSERQ